MNKLGENTLQGRGGDGSFYIKKTCITVIVPYRMLLESALVWGGGGGGGRDCTTIR